MPLGDVTEQSAVISAYFGGDTSGIPASFDAALYTDDPYNGGVEFDYPGYARVTLTNDTSVFVPGGDGSATATATYPDATDAQTTDDASAYVLFNGSAISAWEFLDAPVSIDGAGSIEDVGITVYHPNTDNVSS